MFKMRKNNLLQSKQTQNCRQKRKFALFAGENMKNETIFSQRFTYAKKSHHCSDLFFS